MIDNLSRRSTYYLSPFLRFVDQAFEYFSCDNNKIRNNTDVNSSQREFAWFGAEKFNLVVEGV
jgi:hypothetical protein